MAWPRPRQKSGIEWSWESLVRQADPDYDRRVHNETEFKFSNGREFTADRNKRFPYDQPDQRSIMNFTNRIDSGLIALLEDI